MGYIIEYVYDNKTHQIMLTLAKDKWLAIDIAHALRSTHAFTKVRVLEEQSPKEIN